MSEGAAGGLWLEHVLESLQTILSEEQGKVKKKKCKITWEGL